jgi:hypothetical protein
MSKENLNIENDFKDQIKVSISENQRLKFAKQVLFCLFVITLVVFGLYGTYPDNKALESIFELIKIGVFPLVTLMISFYFSRDNN